MAIWLAGGGTMSCLAAYFVTGIAVYTMLLLRSGASCRRNGACMEHEIGADLLALRQRDKADACYIGKPSA